MPSPASDTAQAQLLAAYVAAQQQSRQSILDAVVALWRQLTSWRDTDIDRWVKQILPIVAGGQQQTATATAAYLAQQRQIATGGRLRMPSVPRARVAGAAVRNGTDPVEVYRRAGVQVWRDLADGKPLGEAVKHGEHRARTAAATDLQLTKTHTAQAVIGSANVVGYRRVLVGEFDCGLCIVASTQRYHKRELLPIHPGCDCDVAELYGDEDPGQTLDELTLEQVHAAIRSTFGVADAGGRAIDYRKLLLVRQHGELGPVLTVKKHVFTGPQAAKSGLDLSNVPSAR